MNVTTFPVTIVKAWELIMTSVNLYILSSTINQSWKFFQRKIRKRSFDKEVFFICANNISITFWVRYRGIYKNQQSTAPITVTDGKGLWINLVEQYKYSAEHLNTDMVWINKMFSWFSCLSIGFGICNYHLVICNSDILWKISISISPETYHYT